LERASAVTVEPCLACEAVVNKANGVDGESSCCALCAKSRICEIEVDQDECALQSSLLITASQTRKRSTVYGEAFGSILSASSTYSLSTCGLLRASRLTALARGTP
jgi:hypothetical protein